MDTTKRILQLMNDRNWSKYRLAIESGLSHSTIANFFKRDNKPTILTLSAICSGFGISLAQFFHEGDLYALTDEQSVFFTKWLTLSPEQKQAIHGIIMSMNQPAK